jgi:hypothetical protein
MSEMPSPESKESTRHPARSTAAVFVASVMVLAALSLWTVIPFSWIYIGSKLSKTQQPTGGPYMLVFAGIVFSILAIAWILSRLNRLYVRLTGTNDVTPIRMPWLKSMRDERPTVRKPTVLEAAIVTSVLLAIVAMVIWFMFIAGSPLPNG